MYEISVLTKQTANIYGDKHNFVLHKVVMFFVRKDCCGGRASLSSKNNSYDQYHSRVTAYWLILSWGSIGHFGMNYRYNLIPLCSKHHRLVHEGKIAIHGFVMGEDGLRLSFSETANKGE